MLVLCLTIKMTVIKVETTANSNEATTQLTLFPNPQKAKFTFKLGTQTLKIIKTQELIMATNDEIIEERETCFEILRVMRKAIKLNPNVIQQVAMAKPAKLATAFPPLK